MRAVTGVVLGVLGSLAASARARPAGQTGELARAKALYAKANQEMAQRQFEQAASDYGAVYDITRDPVLFFKIASADEQAGHCDVALIYFGRYLKEGHPAPKFAAVTEERIRACGGEPGTWSTENAASGAGPPASGVRPSASGSAKETASGAHNATASGATPAAVTGPAAVPAAASPPGAERRAPDAAPLPHTTAWLLVGGSLAFVTTGAVLAYSASSSEQDLRDLYVGVNGLTPAYTPQLAQRYHDLVDEGHRYEYLSWASFAVATGCAVAATILFVRHPHEEHLAVTPVLSPHDAGIAASLTF